MLRPMLALSAFRGVLLVDDLTVEFHLGGGVPSTTVAENRSRARSPG